MTRTSRDPSVVSPDETTPGLADVARLAAGLGQPESRDEAALRLCELAREVLGVAAAAVFLDGPTPRRIAASGFALLPPDGFPVSLDAVELDALAAWGTRAGLAPVGFAPLRLDAPGGEPSATHLGVLALFGGPQDAPLGDELRALLGRIAANALEQARTIEELRRTWELRERSQEQAMRTERLRGLGEMARGIAHDFNNVLNAVLGQVGVLELLAASQPRLLAAIGRLKDAALGGAVTVGRLQEFSRQRRDQEFSRVDLSTLVGETVAAFRERGQNVRIDEHIEAGAQVAGNDEELRDALQAMLENAVEAGSRRIQVDLERCGDELRLTVADDGRGMSRDVRKRAFDPFFTTKGSLVSGLGLSVAYGIVRRHGGRIDLDSAPGQGARVRLRLTAHPPDAADALPSSSAAASPPGCEPTGLRILLVEDDEDNREAMATLLGIAGHAVTAAGSGSEGVRLFAAQLFDLVLTDLGLPDMTGWEVARQVKEQAANVPVALVTGWGLNLAREEIQSRGVDLLIKKPIEPRRFLDQVAGLAGPPLASLSAE